MDLRFNRLQSLPILSATVKRKLRVLLLGGNNISDLRGMCEFVFAHIALCMFCVR